MIPLIGSICTGSLGVCQLPRIDLLNHLEDWRYVYDIAIAPQK